ncbi:MAG TPA: outer membrane beta-barrel protein [Xanthobacteraceae bacterium]|nr:outer membrane beta-barrel protein [Xanthobacteraceae bacterium]
MKKIGILLAALGFAWPAFAGNMVVKAPPPPPVTAPNWMGFYIGGNVGYGWGTANDGISFFQSQATVGPGGPPFASLTASDNNRLSRAIGGIQAGYNWQAQNYLVGLEADIQDSGKWGSSTYGGTIIDTSNGNNLGTITSAGKIEWFGTVRARIGVTSDRWLVYGTGGLAYGEVKANGSVLPAISNALVPNFPVVWNDSATKAGWTLGAGVENAIPSSNWSWKIEYLYIDLGKINAGVSGGLGNCYGPPGGPCNGPLVTPAFGTVTTKITDNIIRLGVNYKFH